MENSGRITVHGAKKIIRAALSARGMANKLTAKSVDFADLARGACVFVTVHGWKPDPYADDLESAARDNGFRVTFSGAGFVS